MFFHRARVALLLVAVSAGSGWCAVGGPQPTKKPSARAGALRQAPATRFPAAGKAARRKASVPKTHHPLAGGAHASRAVNAPVAAPVEGRTATIQRLTESLASARAGLENASALQPFFDQLHALEANPQSAVVRVLQFGDSHTAADMFTGAMRTLFQSKFGDGGAGYSYPGYPFAGYRIHGTRRAQSTGWTVTGTHFRALGDGLLGMGGVSLETARPGSWISLDADGVWLEVQYLLQPGGGPIEIYDGEQLLGRESTDGVTAGGYFDTAVAPGPHHFEVRTSSYAPVRLLGLRTEQAAGMTYEAMGLNGAEAGLILKWNEPLQQTLMEQRDVGLIVLAYGTNEASDSSWTEESYAAMFRRLVERCRRLAPNASILVLGPADRELRAGSRRRASWVPYAGIDRIVRAQRSVCRELGCAYWDQRARMGGFGAMREWVQVGWGQGDHTHFTGEGYNELAAALFSDIVQQYNSDQHPAIAGRGTAR